MPEGITYYDMTRRIRSALPKTDSYRLQLFPEAWMKDRSNIKTFEGKELVHEYIRNRRRQTFVLGPEGIDHYGKELGIRIRADLWLRCHFALHGHAVCMSRLEWDMFSSDIIRYVSLFNYVPVWVSELKNRTKVVQVAIMGSTSVIVIADHCKISRYWVVPVDEKGEWWNKDRGPCPIKCPDEFQDQLEKASLTTSKVLGSRRCSPSCVFLMLSG